MTNRPISIENRWDILYQQYPEVYEAFSTTPYTPNVYDQLLQRVKIAGKLVADVGAGTGLSTFALARHARRVIGVELEPAMLRVAAAKTPPAGRPHVSFLAGDAIALPLANDSVDVVTGITLALWPPEQYRDFIREGLRAARERVVYLGIPPGWYGGELNTIIGDLDPYAAVIEAIFLEEFGGTFEDITSVQEYGTLEHITNTYGFIFGRKVIEHLKQEKQTSILWKFRIYNCNVSKP